MGHIFLEKNRERIQAAYQKRKEQFPKIFEEAERYFSTKEEEVVLAFQYLYSFMPYSDIGNYSVEVFADYAEHSVFLWKNDESVRELPEEIFLNYVLYHRVNEEEIAPCRNFFYNQMQGEISQNDKVEAVKDINYWCAKEASYHCTDERTLAAITVFRRGNGRCGEESTFTVNAMRSMGIPARQVYAPRWSHCDDNHAWVEVWIDGVWYFTGACEPEEILNRGWFTNASSRAMMVHSRLFDTEIPKGSTVIGMDGMVMMLNELDRYAQTDTLEVQVVREDGSFAQGVEVFFEVVNYSEFSPIAECKTDEYGKAQLKTGLGSLHIHARDGKTYAEAVVDVRNTKSVTVCLKEQVVEEGWKSYDMTAPVDTPVNPGMPTPQQKEIGKKRLQEAEEKRLRKISDWVHPDREVFLQKEEHHALREEMLACLTEKDQTDLRADVLEEHLQYAIPFAEEMEHPIFVQYVLNPRVEDEVLGRYRKEISDAFTQQEIEEFKENPSYIWDYISKNIKESFENERASVITTPAASLRLGVASRRSQKVIFVAIARTFGIPARLNPQDQSMEYYKDGIFIPVEAEAEKSCKLILTEQGDIAWKYFQNWSIARFVDGNYISLKLADEVWENQKLEIALEQGQYRILTSNRLPNGNIFVFQYEFGIHKGETKEIQMKLREAILSDMLHSYAIPEFDLYTEDGVAVKASKLTEDGKHIMMFLEEGKEPTEHILNEMLDQESIFQNYDSQILFVVRSKSALEDRTISKALRAFSNIKIYYDDFTENVNMLGRRMYVDHEKLPLILVTDGALNGIYATSGYNVGTGEMLLRVLEA